MAVFVEFNQVNGLPLMINVDHIVCFFPNPKGTEVHLSGGQQVVANKPLTWMYVVAETYEEVKDALVEADAQASLAVIEKLGLDEDDETGEWNDEPETAFPAGWKPSLESRPEPRVETKKAAPEAKKASPEVKVDWEAFEDPPHLKDK